MDHTEPKELSGVNSHAVTINTLSFLSLYKKETK